MICFLNLWPRNFKEIFHGGACFIIVFRIRLQANSPKIYRFLHLRYLAVACEFEQIEIKITEIWTPSWNKLFSIHLWKMRTWEQEKHISVYGYHLNKLIGDITSQGVQTHHFSKRFYSIFEKNYKKKSSFVTLGGKHKPHLFIYIFRFGYLIFTACSSFVRDYWILSSECIFFLLFSRFYIHQLCRSFNAIQQMAFNIRRENEKNKIIVMRNTRKKDTKENP